MRAADESPLVDVRRPLPSTASTFASAAVVVSAAVAATLHGGSGGAALGALLAAAVWEEVLFRGLMQSALLRCRPLRIPWFGFSGANLCTSVVFCAAHLLFHDAVLLPGYLAVSLLLGVARERTHGLAWPIAGHAGLNLAWWSALQPLFTL